VADGFGAVATVLMNALTHAWGWVAGYRDAIWTNWYRRLLVPAVLTLAYMRERLNARNLVSTYPPGALTGFQKEGQTPPRGVTHFRTADGSWNNLADPMEGAAGTRFLRNVNLAAAKALCFRKSLRFTLDSLGSVSQPGRLTGGASAASEEAKPMSESAARACWALARSKPCYSTARFVHCHRPAVTAAGKREPICLATNTICPR
jgi:hypothetical protein